MAGVFSHCKDTGDTWTSFYSLACLCHPAQGGSAADMDALCAEARASLGPEWPTHWTGVPGLFDVFCGATGTPNPFGRSIEAPDAPAAVATDGPPGYEPAAGSYALLPPRVGSVELVFCAAASSSSSSPPK